MVNTQTFDFTNNKTRLHNLIINTGKQIETFERFKIGCSTSECDIFDIIMLDGLICSEKCYYTKDFDNVINDYLVKKQKV